MKFHMPGKEWLLRGYMLLILATGIPGGCVHEEQVTTRPTYAFPQHLVSLCGRESQLAVANRGEFVASNSTGKGSTLLLSAQLSGEELAIQRRITHLELRVSQANGVSVTAFDGARRWLLSTIPAAHLHCDDSGEMLLDYPDDSFYFWASVGNKQRLLALWSNRDGDLVIQNRWLEEHTGLVSGTVSGDAWALFKASTLPDATSPEIALDNGTTAAVGVAACPDLSGTYMPDAEVVHADGSLDSRSALDQFFREEIVGAQAPGQEHGNATELRVVQDDGGIKVGLNEDSTLLAERQLPARSLRCDAGRWVFKGDKNMHSAWLLLAASGGVYWEDLTLWRDHTGALLVEGRYTQRTLLMLIPFGGTQTLFMAFPAKGNGNS